MMIFSKLLALTHLDHPGGFESFGQHPLDAFFTDADVPPFSVAREILRLIQTPNTCVQN